MRRLLAVAMLASVSTAASAEQASTTRIEPRPYYGATVTIEEGVRVFRALPPHKHIIINPGHKTPVNLSFEEKTERSYNYNYNYHEERSAPGFGGGFYGGGFGALPHGFGPGFKHGKPGGGHKGGKRAPLGALR